MTRRVPPLRPVLRPLSVSRRVAAPPERVWDLLVDVSAWPRWGPTVSAVELGTARIEAGSRGRVRTPLGASLPFVVTRFEPGRCWSWSVGGVPATTHAVRPWGGGCEVTFGVPWWAPAYAPVCAVALRRLERLAVTPSGGR